jgi:hypothetical protein
MTAVCPSGHTSVTSDYCDQCGAPIATAPTPTPVNTTSGVVEDVDTSTSAVREPCPTCAAPRSGDDRFCERCGHDFVAAPRSATREWEAVIQADRNYFERFAPAGLSFPARYPEMRIALEGEEVRIGRRRAGSGEPIPDIDLAGAVEDPGVSRLHALLVRQEDDGWAIRDLGSTNGTTVNDDLEAVGTDASVPLAEGDRIHLGVWTTITLRRRWRRSEVVEGDNPGAQRL